MTANTTPRPLLATLARPVGRFTLHQIAGRAPARITLQPIVSIVNVAFDSGTPADVALIARKMAKADPAVFSVAWSRDSLSIVTAANAHLPWSPALLQRAIKSAGVAVEVSIVTDPFDWQWEQRTAEADARFVLRRLSTALHCQLHQCTSDTQWCTCDADGNLSANSASTWAGQIGSLPGQLQDPRPTC